MKHDWVKFGHLTYRCSRCGEYDTINISSRDKAPINNGLKRIKSREDCVGVATRKPVDMRIQRRGPGIGF
jgi:hypothetical protein